jgi:hypothetical protein
VRWGKKACEQFGAAPESNPHRFDIEQQEMMDAGNPLKLVLLESDSP